MALGDILSELRGDKGLSQRKLSEQLNISNSSISAYETGARLPDVEMLKSFADFFDVTTDYLLGRIDTPLPLSVLSEEFVSGVTFSSVLKTLKMLTPEQKRAILLIIENMKFYTAYREISNKAVLNGADKE